MYINNDIDYIKYLKNKDVVIFGAGSFGRRVSKKFITKKINVIYFCDNDKAKKKQVINEIEVLNFDDLLKKKLSNYMIVIASTYEREIKEQLLNNNVFNFISYSQVDFGGGEEFYDESYFEYQKKMGIFGAKIKKSLFEKYINENDAVIEFGSGGGYLLNELNCKTKIGIEINDIARKNARSIGIESVKYPDNIDDDFADVIISTSVLEHVENPLDALRKLRPKLKDGGKIIFNVPSEGFEYEYERSEVNNHLYTWNCLTIGNLFKAAGYFVHRIEKIEADWPMKYEEVYSECGENLFEEISKIEGTLYRGYACLIIAYK